MSGTSRTPQHRDPIARDIRPLPNNPNLEYERKSAKAFLKQLHAGDAEVIGRVQATHPAALREHGPDQLQLADAQHVIAREYGFTSWPRLVEYCEELERHRNAPRFNVDNYKPEMFEMMAQQVVGGHSRGNKLVARQLAHYVPRFFARSLDEILETPITIEDGRLVIARERRRVSWDELIARGSDSQYGSGKDVWHVSSAPLSRAAEAVRRQDIAGLTALLDLHPDVLSPSLPDREWRRTLGPGALRAERTAPSPDARRITDLLAARGLDIQRDLNELLLGWPQDGAHPLGGISTETVQWFLDRGADPEWTPPNGIPILEHAIARYRNGAAVDLIAKRVTPRPALWIAAGVGDVAGIQRFMAGKGRLTPEGRLNRPDLVAMGASVGNLPPYHDADDLEIMYEAFQLAGWNQRWESMDALLAAGFPVDYSPFGWPLILEATGNLIVPLAEYLVSRGADLDREWPNHGSARASARGNAERPHNPVKEQVRQMLAICGAGTLEEIQAALDLTRQSPPPLDEMASRTLRLAADDASRCGQSAITTENILVGLLRFASGVFLQYLLGLGTDMPELRQLIGARLLPDTDPLLGQELQPDAGAEAAIKVATEQADLSRRRGIGPMHLWYGLVVEEGSPGLHFLREAGTDMAKLSERLKSTL